MIRDKKRSLILIWLLSIAHQLTAAESTDNYWNHKTDSHQADASDIALPAISFILPGFGQWARGQWGSGVIYSSLALGSASYAAQAREESGNREIKFTEITEESVSARKYLLGLQASQAIGGISLYHSFRSAVWQRQKFGEYGFLGDGETPLDLLKAPFRFDMLTRSSTFVPLSVVAVASWYLASHPGKGYVKKTVSREDPWFAGAFSFNAGVHEEAVFRGWLMPVLSQSGLSHNYSNLSQAGVFALAHLGSSPLPISQFLLGLHLGRTTLNNKWQISESIFIHTWWDVMVFLATYHTRKSDSPTQTAARLTLPPFQIIF